MLNDRKRHAKIGFLKGSLANKLLVDLTGNRYWNAIHRGIGNTSYQIGGAGANVVIQTPALPVARAYP